jgi:hypothetical protein
MFLESLLHVLSNNNPTSTIAIYAPNRNTRRVLELHFPSSTTPHSDTRSPQHIQLALTTTITMPATRSQKAALASPLATTRKRSVSRQPSAEPPARKVSSRIASKDLGLVVAETTTTTTTTTTNTPSSATARHTKRKHFRVPEEDVEEEQQVEEVEVERPRKKQHTLKDEVFREEVQKRLAEKRLARAKEAADREQKHSPLPAQSNRSPVLHRPGSSERPGSYGAVVATAATPQRITEQQQHHERPQYQQHQQQTPQQLRQPQQSAQPQLQPPNLQAQTPQRGFLGRLVETFSPFKRRPQTPSGADTRLPDARTEHNPLQQQTRPQHQLSQVVEQEEHKTPRANLRQEYHDAQTPGSKRKRTASNEITELPQLNAISESPETRIPERTFKDMSTPSRDIASLHQGIVPKSLPRPRRTVKDARARRSMRGPNEPATPMPTRTAPTTPYDKNNYERIRRAREMEQLVVQQEAMAQKLARLRAQQQAEEDAKPRKTKRVKLEHLKSIPHNLPHEPSGSFRVPEADSDDEMEVDDDASVIENIFTTADDEETTPRQLSPVKNNLFAAATPSVTFEKPAAKTASPVKKSASPIKRAPSPAKKAPSPVKKVVSVVEVEDGQDHMEETSAEVSPEPTQVFSDASEGGSDIDDEDWPELEPRKQGEPEPPQPWRDEALALFDKEFEHWEKTQEIMV